MLRCKICIQLRGRNVKYLQNSLNELKIHSEVHRLQIDDNTIGADQAMFNKCFPDFVDFVDEMNGSGQKNPLVTASVTGMAGEESIITNNQENSEPAK